jgi:Ca2+:H+ antiporter
VRLLIAMLAFVPITVVLRVIGLGPTWIFVAAGLGLVPLSAFIGLATDAVAERTGPRIGGLLNVTLGNAAEMILTIIALREGLLVLAKASISGSILSNTLLVLGASALAGGIRNGRQGFDAHTAGISSTMMTLAVAALAVPALFAIGPNAVETDEREALSILVSVVLLAAYGCYVLYTIVLLPAGEARPPEKGGGHGWSLPVAIGVLAGATLGAVILSELLVRAIEPVIKEWGLTELFVGFIVVPLVGNAAEHWSAVRAAWNNQMDLAVSIAIGSSLQVALFVAPILVFVSLLFGTHMQLMFNEYELAALVGATIVAALIAFDGESNWVEGMQLMSLYAIFGIAFYFLTE